jgi:hypothetical protein
MKSLMFIFLAIGLVSCGGESGENAGQSSSYFYASINGPSWNGEVDMVDTGNPIELTAVGLITPAEGGNPETAILTFTNSQDGLVAHLFIPAETKLLELRDAFDFGMSLTSSLAGVILVSEAVSLDITEFERGGAPGTIGFQGPTKVVGNFEGTMTYENPDTNQIEIHTIKGDFLLLQ